MGKVRLRPPANDTRPTRRSLVELTAAASRAVDDGLVVMPSNLITIALENMPRAEEAANAAAQSDTPGATAPRVAEPANDPSPRRAALPETGSCAEMLVDIVKDHQARALDNIRLGLAAALEYARDRARTPMPADGGARPDDNLRATVGAAAEYRGEAIEIAKAHAATILDFARELAGARTAAEFIEASSALARKQCELMFKQASVLQSFARIVTKTGGSSENG
jgi:hypothetical protein